MNETTLFHWSIQFGLSVFDFIQIYVLAHALTRIKVKLDWVHIGLGLVYATVMTPVFFLFDGYVFRIVAIVLMLFIMNRITKRSLHDLLIIYAILLLIGVFIQLVPLIILSHIALNSWLISLFTQIVSTILLMLICRRFKLNKIFNAIQSQHLLKLMLIF